MSSQARSNLTRIGLAAVAAGMFLLPLAGGCTIGPPEGLGEIDEVDAAFNQGMNARLSSLNLNGADFSDPAFSADTNAAQIDFNGHAGVDNDGDGLDDFSGMPFDPLSPVAVPTFQSFGPADVYGTFAGDRVEVTELNDLNGDGKGGDNGFFAFIHRHPTPNNLQVGFAYGGNRTDGPVIDALRDNNHQATHTGIGEFFTSIGGATVQHAGNLELNVDFGAGTLEGKIDNLNQLSGGAPPTNFDELLFNGTLDSRGTADYVTNNFRHRNNGKNVTNLTSKGAGSFFGPQGDATLGVFSGTGQTVAGGQNVNLLGGYRASE
jgi:hypothetical protein